VVVQLGGAGQGLHGDGCAGTLGGGRHCGGRALADHFQIRIAVVASNDNGERQRLVADAAASGEAFGGDGGEPGVGGIG